MPTTRRSKKKAPADEPSESGSAYFDLNLDSDDDSILSLTQRMTSATVSAGPKQVTVPKLPESSAKASKTVKKMDPPFSAFELKPLVPLSDMRGRHQNVQLNGRLFDHPRNFVGMFRMLAGQTINHFKIARDEHDKCKIIITMEQDLDSTVLLHLLCSGQFAATFGAQQVPLHLLPSDMFVRSSCNQLDTFNGSEREDVTPKAFFVLTLDKPVKPVCQPLTVTQVDGKFFSTA